MFYPKHVTIPKTLLSFTLFFLNGSLETKNLLWFNQIVIIAQQAQPIKKLEIYYGFIGLQVD